MTTFRTYRDLTPEEAAAVQAFAAAHPKGRLSRGCNSWKDELSDIYWYNARLWKGGPDESMGNVLHGLRNDLGPRWLHESYQLPKIPA